MTGYILEEYLPHLLIVINLGTNMMVAIFLTFSNFYSMTTDIIQQKIFLK
jgi:hypothetical protein